MMLHCMYSRRFETLRVHLKHCFKHLLSLHNLVDSNWFTFFQLFNALWTRFPLTLMSSTQNQILFKCRSGCQLCWFFITYMQYFSVKKLVIHACDIYLSSSGKRSSAVEAAKLLCGYYLMRKSKSFLHQQRPLSWKCSLNHVQMSCNNYLPMFWLMNTLVFMAKIDRLLGLKSWESWLKCQHNFQPVT